MKRLLLVAVACGLACQVATAKPVRHRPQAPPAPVVAKPIDNKTWLQEQLSNAVLLATDDGDLSPVRRLLAQGADVNGRDGNDQAPLSVAADTPGGHRLDVVLFLVNHGAKVRRNSPYLENVVIRSAFQDASDKWDAEVELLRLLLKSGADPNETSEGGVSALEMAVFLGDTPAFEVLWSITKKKNRLKLFSDALVYNSTEMIAALLQDGLTIGEVMADGQRPVRMAVLNIGKRTQGEVLATVHLLLNAGANPAETTRFGEPVLIMAEQKGYTDVSELSKSALAAKANAASGPATTAQAVYQNVLPSIVTLYVKNKDGTSDLGSGFMAIRPGMAVTAWHVAKDAKRVVACFSDGKTYEVPGLVSKDEKRDIALLSLNVPGHTILSIARNPPAVGSQAYVIGAPKRLEFSITDGLVSQLQNLGGSDYIQFSCPTSPGNSGGPLVNGSSEVVGVVDKQLSEGQNLSFAVPVSALSVLNPDLPVRAWSE